MWHNIRGNKSRAGLARVAGLACDYDRAAAGATGTTVYYSANRVAVSVCVLRDGEVTRQHQVDYATPLECWDYFERIGASKSPINLFTYGAALTLPAAGIFHAIDSGRLLLRWPGVQRLKNGVLPSKPKIVDGIVCLQTPPVIVIGRLRSGAIFRVFDLSNWGDWPAEERADAVTLAHERMLRGAYLVQFAARHDLGQFRWTISSQAMGAYRHRGMKRTITVHDISDVTSLESSAYYGGRVSVWYRPEITPKTDLLPDGNVVSEDGPQYTPHSPVVGVDVNGLFPAVMSSYTYPCRLVDWRILPEGQRTRPPDNLEACVASCLLSAHHREYPVRVAGDTTYRTGTLWTVLAGPELAAAMGDGSLLAVGSWARYELSDLFGDWVRELWALRVAAVERGDPLEASLFKGLLVRLYGKFAQRQHRWENVTGIDSPGPWQQWHRVDERGRLIASYRSLGRVVQQLCDRGYVADAMPAIAAFVTANARMYMDHLRGVVGRGHVYYQAVDSMYTSVEGYERLEAAGYIHPTRLGGCKKEGQWSRVHFRNANHYILDGQHVCAGRSLTAVHLEGDTWSEVEVPSLDVQVAKGPREGVTCNQVQSRWPAGVVPGRVNSYGWVLPLAGMP